MFAEVAVNSGAPHRGAFTYRVPPGMQVRPGHAVYVPFGNRIVQGVVLALSDTTEIQEVRSVARLAAEEPLIDEMRARLASWLAAEYLAPIFASAVLFTPPGFDESPRTTVILTGQLRPRLSGARQRAAWEALLAAGGELELAELCRRLGVRSAASTVSSLERIGAVRRVTLLRRPRGRPRTERWLRATGATAPEPRSARTLEALAAIRSAPQHAAGARQRFGGYAIRRLLDLGLIEEYGVLRERDPLAGLQVEPRPAPRLTGAQAAARDAVTRDLDAGRHAAFLLHGVTGSGKTEVYLAALEHAVARGRRGIVLVPEISLTPQTIRRFAERFPGRVAVLHSRLSMGERYDQWHAIHQGRYDVVVGPRSAIFAPQPDLGLVVVDEEHEWTYKQDELAPRYDARRVAEELARAAGAVLLLGSATPDVVSYHRAISGGGLTLLELEDRVAPSATGPAVVTARPRIEVVDLRAELLSGNRSIFSRSLAAALRETLDAGEQSILFLNRRGSATNLTCRDCGNVPSCPTCALALTVHEFEGRLVCHYCGRKRQIPLLCPRCGSARLKPLGIGTQRVEIEVTKLLPDACVVRWDRDVSTTRGAQDEVLEPFLRGEADVLVGTQMVAKGFDVPRVTLVGVVLADTSLNLPDFRAGERTFQLLTQVAGRAGRRDLAGRAIVQSYRPDHPAIQTAASYDYEGFFAGEVASRQRNGYPPFGRLALLSCQHLDGARVERAAAAMAAVLRERARRLGLPGVEVRGPLAPHVERLKGRFRRMILLRAPDPHEVLEGVEFGEGWVVDIDPASALG